MNTQIITKFTVVTEQGMDALLMLTKEISREKFSGLVEARVLEDYIAEHFNEQNLIVEVNSMSNQWLVVYTGEEPAGYARLTSKGERPACLDLKRAIRLADFGLLKKHADPAIRQSLFDKCIAVCRSYEAIWINEYPENSLLNFFETQGFGREGEICRHDELPLQTVCLIKHQG